MVVRFTVDREFGVQEFRVDEGTHTILIDTKVMKQQAIADFLKEVSARYKKHSAVAVSEDIAIAVGLFDVPLSMLYDDDTTSIAQLDDVTLATIVRLRMEREEKQGEN
jgi:hypothetical protein